MKRKRSQLLRRNPHFRCRGLDIRRDVLLEFGEVLLEHVDQVSRRPVELGLVLPGLERVEQMRLNAWHGGGHREARSEEHTSELQSLRHLVCRLLLEKKKKTKTNKQTTARESKY